jgi:hypothetical protein
MAAGPSVAAGPPGRLLKAGNTGNTGFSDSQLGLGLRESMGGSPRPGAPPFDARIANYDGRNADGRQGGLMARILVPACIAALKR